MNDTRTLEVEIGGRTVYVRKFEPFLSVRVLGTLQKSLLAPLLKALEAKNAVTDDEAGEAIAAAIGNLSDRLSGEELERMMKTLIQKEYVSIVMEPGEKPRRLDEGAINTAFEDITPLFELAVEVVKHNWAGFGKRVVALIGEARSSKESLLASSEKT